MGVSAGNENEVKECLDIPASDFLGPKGHKSQKIPSGIAASTRRTAFF